MFWDGTWKRSSSRPSRTEQEWCSSAKKTSRQRDLFELGTRVQNAIAGRAKHILNDRVDIALALNADGVQLPEDRFSVADARRIVGPNLLIGRSVHSVSGRG